MAQFRSPLAVFSLKNEEQLSDFESMTQGTVTLGGTGVAVQFLCRLPSNAQCGDYLHASVTFASQRQSVLVAHYTLSQRDLDNNVVALTMSNTTTVCATTLQDFALLQLNLHGRHNMIKESAQFGVRVHPDTDFSQPVAPPASKGVGKRLMSYCQRWLN